MTAMEVVLNFEGSRRVVEVPEGSKLEVELEKEMVKRFPDRDFLVAPIVGNRVPQSPSKDVYIIQKLTPKWGYLDVTDRAQVQADDEVTLVKQKRQEGDLSDPHQHTMSAVSKVLKPSKAEASALGKLFPSTPSLPKLSSGFDPSSDLVFAAQKKRKKAARVKPSLLNLSLLGVGTTMIPRGKHRKAMLESGRVQKVEFTRDLSAQVVRNKILAAFSAQDLRSGYTLLSQSQDGRLAVADNQYPTGQEFVEKALKHRGNVYLTIKKQAVIGQEDSSSSDSDLPVVSLQGSHNSSHSNSETSASLQEWRQIRREQDLAYQESLEIDREKERKRRDQERKEQELARKRRNLQEMFAAREGPLRVAFRLPHSARAVQTFQEGDLPKVLYQYVFSLDVSPPFVLKTTQMQVIDHSSSSALLDLSLDLSTLVVVEDESGPILNQFLDSTENAEDALQESRSVDSGAMLQECSAVSSAQEAIAVLERAKADRQDFIATIKTDDPMSHEVKRREIFESVIKIFSGGEADLKFPLRINFHGEKGVDIGGVYRDMLSAFWDEACRSFFDGGSPVLHPQVDMAVLPVLGKVLSHGYLSSGFLPPQVAFPVLAALLLKCTVVGDGILVAAFLNQCSLVDAGVLRRCLLHAEKFSGDEQAQLISIFSRYGCRQLPTPHNLRGQILQLARFQFLVRPYAALQAIASGVPDAHFNFWRTISVEALHGIYLALSASPQKVLAMLKEPALVVNHDQQKTLDYLRQFIGDMRVGELQRFLRFVTGSSVCLPTGVEVSFNSLTRAARRPIAHACSGLLELPSSYLTYEEFAEEFRLVLFSEYGFDTL